MKKYIILRTVTVILSIVLFVTFISGFAGNSEKPLKFDHYLHVHEASMACSDCHESLNMAEHQSRYLPDHDICSTCHEVEETEECVTCHLDPDNPVSVPEIEGLYEGFAHKNHSGTNCDNCHGVLSQADNRLVIPVMKNCQACHLENNASLECTACHNGRRPLPYSHQLLSWSVDHGMDALVDQNGCASCHEQQSCDECHQGENILADSPHPPTWRFNHFSDSGYGSECLACHETRSSCVECHRSVLGIPHDLGSGFANNQDGGDHVVEAEGFFEACLSCHDVEEGDPTCARCHD